MPDINDLLAWATANTPAPAAGAAGTSNNDASGENDQQLSIRFNPTSTPSAGSSALHPSDPGMPTHQALAPSDTAPTAEKRSDLTSEMLDHILGKSDSLIMKEKMAIALDTTNSIDDRVQALDDFEMLIEMIDNANNMAILKLWNPLLELLKSEHQPVVAHACWIIGTAVQNNPKAQAALFTFGVLPPILDIIYPPSSSSTKSYTSTRAKATYALSSALKHWPLAASALASSSGDGPSGYSVLKRGVRDSEPVIRRKMAFLVGTLVMQDGEKYEGEVPGEVRNLVESSQKENGPEVSLVAGLKEQGVFGALVEGLQEGGDDVEYDENVVRALSRAAQRDGLTSDQSGAVKALWAKWGSAGQAERGFEGEDAEEITRVFA